MTSNQTEDGATIPVDPGDGLRLRMLALDEQHDLTVMGAIKRSAFPRIVERIARAVVPEGYAVYDTREFVLVSVHDVERMDRLTAVGNQHAGFVAVPDAKIRAIWDNMVAVIKDADSPSWEADAYEFLCQTTGELKEILLPDEDAHYHMYDARQFVAMPVEMIDQHVREWDEAWQGTHQKVVVAERIVESLRALLPDGGDDE